MERGITSFIKVGFLVGIFFLGGLWVFRLINSSEKLEFWVHFKTALFSWGWWSRAFLDFANEWPASIHGIFWGFHNNLKGIFVIMFILSFGTMPSVYAVSKKKKNPFQFKVLCGNLLDVVQVTTCFVHKQISGKRCEGLIRLFRGFARASFHFLFLTLKAKKTRVYAPAAITLIIIGLLGMYWLMHCIVRIALE